MALHINYTTLYRNYIKFAGFKKRSSTEGRGRRRDSTATRVLLGSVRADPAAGQAMS
jgi:hypothetical protein